GPGPPRRISEDVRDHRPVDVHADAVTSRHAPGLGFPRGNGHAAPMADLADGESKEMQGSGSKPYVLRNTGGVYSCSCPAWRNQSSAIERRTCKKLRKLPRDAAEEARLGGALPQKPVRKASTGADGEEEGDAGPPLLLAETWDNAADL